MWHPVNVDFFIPQLPVSIVSLPDSGGRAGILRSLLKSLNCVVLTHPMGTPGDFLKVIAQQDTAPRYLIIVGHGEPDGLWFGSYAPYIDSSMLQGECLPATVIRQHVGLEGCTIIADCCYGGTKEMTDAFLSNGAKAYIGTDKALGAALNVFLVNFFYRVLYKKVPDKEAVEQAIQATGPEVESLRYFAGK